MRTHPIVAAALFLLAGLCLPASAEILELRPQYQPGDAYRLSLSVTTDTEAVSRRVGGESFGEQVRLLYEADVVVLEVDGQQRPVRERHEDVRLTFERPEERGSLFGEEVAYEVQRDGDAAGEIRVLSGERRIDRRVERIVSELLASQFEYGLTPKLLDPGRPVEVGDSWELDPSLVRRLLRERGVRAVAFDGPARATLERHEAMDGGHGLAVRYRVPIASFELDRMPANLRTARSEARLEGSVQLGSPARHAPLVSDSDLQLRVAGVDYKPGLGLSAPFRLERSVSADQRTEPIAQPTAAAVR